MTTFEDAFQIVIGHEGGLSTDPRDRGNWTTGTIGKGRLLGTKYGVSAMAYPTLDIPNLTLADARRIYFQNYWTPAGCEELPAPLALVVFDTAVNSGVGRAKQFLAQTQDWGRYLDVRLSFLQNLSTWGTFGRGWQKRVDTLRVQAREWAARPAAIPAAAPAVAAKRVLLSQAGGPFQDVTGTRLDIKNAKSVVVNDTDGEDVWIRID